MTTIITPIGAVDAIQRVPVDCWVGPFIVNGAPVVSIIAGSALAYSLQTAPATDG